MCHDWATACARKCTTIGTPNRPRNGQNMCPKMLGSIMGYPCVCPPFLSLHEIGGDESIRRVHQANFFSCFGMYHIRYIYDMHAQGYSPFVCIHHIRPPRRLADGGSVLIIFAQIILSPRLTTRCHVTCLLALLALLLLLFAVCFVM